MAYDFGDQVLKGFLVSFLLCALGHTFWGKPNATFWYTQAATCQGQQDEVLIPPNGLQQEAESPA